MEDQDSDIQKEREGRFRILVCIDGSDESYASIRYAAMLGLGVDADIVLLYVRPSDQGLRSGGFQVDVARENMLSWGLELPGIKYLKKGRDLLKEMGHIDDSWTERYSQSGVNGDPLGDNKIEYMSEDGKLVALKLKVANDVASGILDQWELGPYNLIILGTPGRWGGKFKTLWDPAIAAKVAIHAPCSVLIARDLEPGRGHLICTDGSDMSSEAVFKDAELATRCYCPVSLLSVAQDVESEPEAKRVVEETKAKLLERGIKVVEAITKVGNPVEEIIETGAGHSVIVLSETSKTGLKRFFMGSVAFSVMQDAKNSVMIVR